MKILIHEDARLDNDNELVVAGLYENETVQEAGLTALDKILGNAITLARRRGDFTGANEQMLALYGHQDPGPRRVLLLGLGKCEQSSVEQIRRAFGEAGKYARTLKLKNIAIVPPLRRIYNTEYTKYIVAACEGLTLAMYRFSKYRSRELEKYPVLDELRVLPLDDVDPKLLEEAAAISRVTIDSTLYARDLVATPSMDLYPQTYARLARELESTRIQVEVLEIDRLKQLGLGALLAVGQGSSHSPCLIHLSYQPINRTSHTLALVGKGITFDAGGLDLKTAQSMRDMKVDMGGSAVVMGIFKALDAWKPNCRVEGFIPAAENMPSGNAYHPGDVIKSYRGLTIEIDNTDAEGRLILADALAYAIDTTKPDALIDFATLTGACVVALGEHATGLMSNDDNLANLVASAGEAVGERTWRLPLWNEYTKQLKSEIADLKNTGGKSAGAITAAAFLKEFVANTPWVHLDIAGTAFEVTATSYVPHKELPTGVGVRTILEFLRRWE